MSFQAVGGAVRRFQASVNARCVSVPTRSAVEVYVAAPTGTARVGRTGRFSLARTLPKQQIRDRRGKVLQTLYSVKVTIAGRVAGGSASGTIKVTYSKNWFVSNPSTGLLTLVPAACSTGRTPVRWSARR